VKNVNSFESLESETEGKRNASELKEKVTREAPVKKKKGSRLGTFEEAGPKTKRKGPKNDTGV